MLVTIPTNNGFINAIFDNVSSLDDNIDTLIIACYGFNGERSDVHRMTVKFARYLSEKKTAVLRFDYLGLGVSDGEYHTVTLETKIRDTINVINFVTGNIQNINKIILLGFSDGATVAMSTAQSTKCIDGLLLWSPSIINHIKSSSTAKESIINKKVKNDSTYKEPSESPQSTSDFSLKHVKNQPAKKDGYTVIPLYGLWSNIRYNNVNVYELIEDFYKSDISLGIICGSSDDIVIPTCEKIENVFKDRGYFIKHVLNADHTFNRTYWETDVFKYSFDWINQLI